HLEPGGNRAAKLQAASSQQNNAIATSNLSHCHSCSLGLCTWVCVVTGLLTASDLSFLEKQPVYCVLFSFAPFLFFPFCEAWTVDLSSWTAESENPLVRVDEKIKLKEGKKEGREGGEERRGEERRGERN
ncbi:hypothetical protein L345_16460, partial [Ophiophagus hannah]